MTDYLTLDRQLAAAGYPLCPRCGERDRVRLPGDHHGPSVGVVAEGEQAVSYAWCDRCNHYLAALTPRAGRHVPDF